MNIYSPHFSNIENDLRQLNYNWFISKKKNFTAHGRYSKDEGCISDSWIDIMSCYDQNWEVYEYDSSRRIQMSISQYCWNNTCVYEGNSDKIDPEINAVEVCSKITLFIEDLLKEEMPVEQKHYLICSYLSDVTLILNDMARTANDLEYQDFINDFIDRFSKELQKRFYRIKMAASVLQTSVYKIRSKYNKKKTTVFLKIMERAFLDPADRRGSDIYRFFENTIWFKKDAEENNYKKFESASAEFSDLKTKPGEYMEDVTFAYDRLREVVNDIRCQRI